MLVLNVKSSNSGFSGNTEEMSGGGWIQVNESKLRCVSKMYQWGAKSVKVSGFKKVVEEGDDSEYQAEGEWQSINELLNR